MKRIEGVARRGLMRLVRDWFLLWGACIRKCAAAKVAGVGRPPPPPSLAPHRLRPWRCPWPFNLYTRTCFVILYTRERVRMLHGSALHACNHY